MACGAHLQSARNTHSAATSLMTPTAKPMTLRGQPSSPTRLAPGRTREVGERPLEVCRALAATHGRTCIGSTVVVELLSTRPRPRNRRGASMPARGSSGRGRSASSLPGPCPCRRALQSGPSGGLGTMPDPSRRRASRSSSRLRPFRGPFRHRTARGWRRLEHGPGPAAARRSRPSGSRASCAPRATRCTHPSSAPQEGRTGLVEQCRDVVDS